MSLTTVLYLITAVLAVCADFSLKEALTMPPAVTPAKRCLSTYDDHELRCPDAEASMEPVDPANLALYVAIHLCTRCTLTVLAVDPGTGADGSLWEVQA